MDKDTYDEMIQGAREDASATFTEEQLAYWFCGPGRGGEEFPPEPRRVDADAHARFASDKAVPVAGPAEWKVYADEFRQAVSFASRYVEKNWDPDSEDGDHHDEVSSSAEAKIEAGDYRLTVL